MGWPKYREDDLSIYCGRMIMRDSILPMQGYAKVTPHQDCQMLLDHVSCLERTPSNQKKAEVSTHPRKGLELQFHTDPPKEVTKKLQMNGWWWSSTDRCWCNSNMLSNRNFANKLRVGLDAKLRVL